MAPRCGRSLRLAAAVLGTFMAACATASPVETVPVAGAEPPGVAAERLPPVPPVDGPLRLDLVYPPEGATVTADDSTFVFGSTGSGRTRLEINGIAVPVAPNGAFLGFLPVPWDGVYRLEAMNAGEIARFERQVRVPGRLPERRRAWIVPGSIHPTGPVALPRGEIAEVGFTGTAGGRASLWLPSGERVRLVEIGVAADAPGAADFQRTAAMGARPALATYGGVLTIRDHIVSVDGSVTQPLLWTADHIETDYGSRGERGTAATRGTAVLELVVGADTVREPLSLELVPLDPETPRVGVVEAPPEAESDWTIRARLATSGPFHYFWPPGTRVWLTGERYGMFRVALAEGNTAWVPASDVRVAPPGTPPPVGSVDGARMTSHHGFVDLRIPVPQRMPFAIDEDERALHISVFGATSRINFFQYGGLDPLIERAEWRQPSDRVLRFAVHLTQPVWGYNAFYDPSGALILRIRRPPAIDAQRPLAGLLVAVDAGHPPGGATGPTRLTEADANLAIAQRLRPMLESAGARVLMTREGTSAVDLGVRPRLATDADADVLVSIHNNAFPDGVNPFENNGTSVYYYHPHSADMALAFQRELLAELGLRDLGIGRADLALARPTWMPSVLTETAFLMVPQQEAALRDEQVQDRIARAHMRGLEVFLRRRAEASR